MYNELLIQGIDNFEKKIEDYARLLLTIGVRFKKGWALAVECPITAPELGRAISKMAYEMGARDVMMCWFDHYAAREKYTYSSDEYLGAGFDWPQYARDKYKDDLAFIMVESYNVDFYKNLDLTRNVLINQSVQKSFSSLKYKVKIPYTICVGASKEWANKVLPDLSDDEAYIKLWNLIFEIVYVDGVNDPVKIWEDKIKDWIKIQDKLNEYHFEKLHITSDLGTDVEVKLPKNHLWLASPVNFTLDGLMFSANIPTEETFTVPEKTGVNGKIVASKPMICKSGPVYGAKFEVKDGKIVKFQAEEGEERLKHIMASDKNGHYLGEFAIVPFDTPISKSGFSFFNNLIDENSGCHMAVGNAYSKCIEGGLQMSEKDLVSEGINVCSFHEDFIFGTLDTKIVGFTSSGQEILIFDKGAYTI